MVECRAYIENRGESNVLKCDRNDCINKQLGKCLRFDESRRIKNLDFTTEPMTQKIVQWCPELTFYFNENNEITKAECNTYFKEPADEKETKA